MSKGMYKAGLIIILIFAAIHFLEKKACNKKGSIADKINWAGHNCNGN